MIVGGALATATGAGATAGVPTIIAGVGMLAGTSTGIAVGDTQIKALEGDKKAQEDALKQMYLNSLTSMVSEVNAKKREQQIREYQSQR